MYFLESLNIAFWDVLCNKSINNVFWDVFGSPGWALGDPWVLGTPGPWGPLGLRDPWALGTPGPWGTLSLGDPWALGTLGPWGPWALGTLGPLGPIYYTDILPEIYPP